MFRESNDVTHIIPKSYPFLKTLHFVDLLRTPPPSRTGLGPGTSYSKFKVTSLDFSREITPPPPSPRSDPLVLRSLLLYTYKDTHKLPPKDQTLPVIHKSRYASSHHTMSSYLR